MKILPNLCYCVYVYFNNKIRNLFSNSQRSFLEIPSSLPKIPRQFSSYLVDVILEVFNIIGQSLAGSITKEIQILFDIT